MAVLAVTDQVASKAPASSVTSVPWTITRYLARQVRPSCVYHCSRYGCTFLSLDMWRVQLGADAQDGWHEIRNQANSHACSPPPPALVVRVRAFRFCLSANHCGERHCSSSGSSYTLPQRAEVCTTFPRSSICQAPLGSTRLCQMFNSLAAKPTLQAQCQHVSWHCNEQAFKRNFYRHWCLQITKGPLINKGWSNVHFIYWLQVFEDIVIDSAVKDIGEVLWGASHWCLCSGMTGWCASNYANYIKCGKALYAIPCWWIIMCSMGRYPRKKPHMFSLFTRVSTLFRVTSLLMPRSANSWHEGLFACTVVPITWV